jgi:membrane fusion protein, heavy metal efflux system
MRNKNLILAIILIGLAAVSAGYYLISSSAPVKTAEATGTSKTPPGKITSNQMRRLGIETVAAVIATSVPLGSVAATVTLPPEASVAVTAPFTGSIVQLYVVAGQAVTRGQPLAILKSREPVQIGADLARARSRMALAQATSARTNQLVQEGIIAGARGDEASAQLKQARTDVAESQRILSQAGASANGQITLRAPISGRLAKVNVQTGGPVDGMTAPFVVEATSSYMLDLQVPERLAGAVRTGMDIEIAQVGPGDLGVGGKIISVGASLDPATRSVLAKARVGASPNLIAGKNVMVIIKGDGAQTGVRVPAKSITQLDNKDVVFVLRGEKIETREIVIAARGKDHVVISEGLAVGEQVAVTGLSELKVMLAGE